MERIYLDHMASTPLDPGVREAMLPWLDAAAAGNPHSAHRAGWSAADAVERARAEVARLIGASPGEIVFTSGATEANNLALFGASRPGDAVIVSAIEHPSVLACAAELGRRGHPVRVVPVDGSGTIDRAALSEAVEGSANSGAIVSVMAANHEVGMVQPLAEIVGLARDRGAIVHTDATQALSTRSLDVCALGIDLLSMSAHKLYGPQGIGALWVRDGVVTRPVVFGGGQERGRRAGTLPVALVAGFGEACRIARERRAADAARLRRLRDRLFAGICSIRPDAVRNGATDGLGHCLSVTLPGIDADDLLLDLPGLCLSTGSACATGRAEPSPVLQAMCRSPEAAHATLRFGLGRYTSEGEIDRALHLLAEALAVRPLAPADHG